MRNRNNENKLKRYLLLAVIILTSFNSFGQQISYEEWQKLSKTEIRLLPEFGNVPKTDEQKAADEELIQAELKENGTHRQASDKLITIGFDYMYRGDLRTAMYRFNQAWLLDPSNENVYWGYGAIYFTFNDSTEAFKQYEKGLALNPKSSNILTDKASVYMMLFERGNDQNNLKIAIRVFNESYAIDKGNQNTLFKLSVCYFLNNDCANAWRYYDECEKLGGKPITEEYTQALKGKCNK